MFKRVVINKYLICAIFLILVLITGGCEQASETKMAQVDLGVLLEESEEAARLQQEFEERESDFAEYYHQIDIGGPETGEQYSVYQRYLQLVEDRQQKLDELIAKAIDNLEIEDDFAAVVTADTSYKVSEDITLRVAEEIDNMKEETEENRENNKGEKSYE